jgi:uncharacterized protein YabE (DUF348 family)
VALFEVATAVGAAAAVVPAAVSAAKGWLAAKHKRDRQITITLSDGEKLEITTSKVDTDKFLQFLAKVQSDELAAQDGSLPSREEK